MVLGGCSQRLPFQEAVVSTHPSSPSQPSFLDLTSCPDFAFQFLGALMSYFLQPPIYLTLDPSLSTFFSPLTHMNVDKLLLLLIIFLLFALSCLSNLCFPRSTKLYFNLFPTCLSCPVAFWLTLGLCCVLSHHLIVLLLGFYGHLDEGRQVKDSIISNEEIVKEGTGKSRLETMNLHCLIFQRTKR